MVRIYSWCEAGIIFPEGQIPEYSVCFWMRKKWGMTVGQASGRICTAANWPCGLGVQGVGLGVKNGYELSRLGAWVTCYFVYSQMISLGDKVTSSFLSILSFGCTLDICNSWPGTRQWGLAVCRHHLHTNVLEVPKVWLLKRTYTKRRGTGWEKQESAKETKHERLGIGGLETWAEN